MAKTARPAALEIVRIDRRSIPCVARSNRRSHATKKTPVAIIGTNTSFDVRPRSMKGRQREKVCHPPNGNRPNLSAKSQSSTSPATGVKML